MKLEADGRDETESCLGVERPRCRNDIAYHNPNTDKVRNLNNGTQSVICMVFIIVGGSLYNFHLCARINSTLAITNLIITDIDYRMLVWATGSLPPNCPWSTTLPAGVEPFIVVAMLVLES